MAGTAITPPPAAGMDIAAGQALTSSYVNSFRISAVAERLAMHVHSTPKTDAVEFFNLCLSLARGIDYAVANNEVPGRAQELAFQLKQACQRKNDSLLQGALMVLMISVKNACKIGWFSDKDSEELLGLANEIASSFCSVRDINTEASGSLPTISKLMSRFYPRMRMGQILAFLEVKEPGYGTFVIDFHISKNTKSSPEQKIRLFVAQTDNIETSSCIISPPQVNFLLNGKGVERRTNVLMDTGPQIPTIVTPMLKYGTNLLQAVGQFNGNYIIVIAFMSVISNLECPVLQNYDQPAVAAPDSDSDIIEGPSRISLNCPISFRRIKVPVKGHSCKHLQCFDFDNFVDINSRRPSWRCPHCNQYVCYTDIRVDQNMAKVLREVGENVADVIISADGSWKAVMESNDHKDQSHDKTSNCQPNGPTQQESTSFSDAVPDILDLTEGSDDMDVAGIRETEDRKPLLANLQSPSSVTNLTSCAEMYNMSEVNRNTASHIEDDFWSGIFLSTHGLGASSARSDAQIIVGASEPAPTNFRLSPVLTDAVSPALNREPETFRGTTLLATSVPQSQTSATNNLQLQQSQFANSIVSNEYGRFPSIPRHVNRTPIAVQALPAQTPSPVPLQRSRNSLNTLIPNGPSFASQSSPALPSIADGSNAVSSNVERQQQFSRSHLNQLQVSHMTASSLQQHSAMQSRNHQDHSFIVGQPAQPIVSLPAPSQLPSAYRVSSALPTAHQNSHSHAPSQSPGLFWSSAHFPRAIVHQGGAQSGVGHTQRDRLMAALRAKRARESESVQVPIKTSRTASSFPGNVDGFRASLGEQRGNTGGTVQPVTTVDGLPAEQNWRPAGRMRGSLSGRAYSAALNQYIIQPTQPVQAARPPSNMTLPSPSPSPSPGIPSQVHVLMPNSRNAHAPQVANYPPTEPAGGLGVPPEQSSGMH
uniref:Putative E3 SUMO-protein ligase pli1 n=1 Tax=Davidia involucrata TaxID=16924 RepID=A0A5B7APQ5_DAVIN